MSPVRLDEHSLRGTAAQANAFSHQVPGRHHDHHDSHDHDGIIATELCNDAIGLYQLLVKAALQCLPTGSGTRGRGTAP